MSRIDSASSRAVSGKKKKHTAAKQPAAAALSSATQRAAAESSNELEDEAQSSGVSTAVQQSQQPLTRDGTDEDDNGGDARDGDRERAESPQQDGKAAEESAGEDDSDNGQSDIQSMLLQLLQQQKRDKAIAKQREARHQAEMAQLRQQLQQQATSAVRLGTAFSATGVPAPAARSTLKTEPGVLAQQQAAATAAAAPGLSAAEVQQRAAAARAPGAPAVQAAAQAAPPRRELPKVKQELEAVALAKEPALLKAWVFQMERLLKAMELSSTQEFTFGDRLSVAQDHWDAGMEAWWTSLCDARAAAGQPAVCSWAGLLAALHETYAPVADGLAAAREMHAIKQGASETMEAYVRRVLELQSRIPPGRLPSHVIGDLALNGVDESRFPWTLSIVRGEATAHANAQPSGQGPDMAFLAHRLRTQAHSEPKVGRGAGGGGSSAEFASLKAEVAKMQRQMQQHSQVTHMAALYTAGGGGSSSSPAQGTSKSGIGGTWRGGSRGRGARGGRGGGATSRQPLDDAELNRRFDAGLCFECGEEGHIGRDCPKRAARKQQLQYAQQNERGAEGAPSSGN